MGRFDNLREIERLDPERDHQRIVHLVFGYEFPWDTVRALEVALYRTYCVPSISALLDRSGEFYRAAQRRYANDDFLYVLSTFIYEPIRWLDRYGWRPTCRNERLAFYWFWRRIGERMGIRDIPASYETFEEWAAAYERLTFRFTESNRKIGEATRDLFTGWYPRALAPVVHRAIYALLDDTMLEAFGFPRPHPLLSRTVSGSLALRGRLVRFLPARRQPHFFTDGRNRTHPKGYAIAGLGPDRLRDAERRKQPSR